MKAFRADLVKQYGATNGNPIADGKVKLGMNKDMCATARGMADKVIKTQVGADIIETWFYYYGYNSSTLLKFKDGKLVQVVE